MDWVRGERIGHGSFGTVNLAIPRSQKLDDCSVMAVKSCVSSHSDSLLNEKLILDELRDCPQIIKSFGDCVTHENGERLYNVLLEYAAGGDLGKKIKNSCAGKLSEFEVRRCTRAVLQGVNSIHGNGYVHCDIKLQNVLLFSSKFGGNDCVKIADFGLAKRAGKVNFGSEIRGTPMYMSPEMVAGGEQEAPADIWALGCMVAEMLTGAPAWRCRQQTDFAALFMRIGVGEEVPEIPGELSEEGKDFLGKCFIKDPTKRWTAEMLLHHPFVSKFGDDCACVDVPSTSPRSAFDFPDWVSDQSSEITLLPSPESSKNHHIAFDSSFSTSPGVRLDNLVTDHQTPNWSGFDSWVTVRS